MGIARSTSSQASGKGDSSAADSRRLCESHKTKGQRHDSNDVWHQLSSVRQCPSNGHDDILRSVGSMRPCPPLTLRLSWPAPRPARPVGPQRYRELLADVLRQRIGLVALGTVPGTKGGSQDGPTTPSWSRGSPWRAEAHEVAVGLDAEPLKIQYVIEAQRPAVSEIRVPTKP